jgi:predicted nuclease of predicted toxin-antitoxin system
MRFLVYESTGPAVAYWLRNQQHEIFSIYAEARGMSDDDVIQKAFLADWILITNDKDFGDKVYRERKPHNGVVLLRLVDERAQSKIEVIKKLLMLHSNKLKGSFVVVTESRIRFAQKP